MTKKLYPDLIPFVDSYITKHKFFSIRNIAEAFSVTVKYEVYPNQNRHGIPKDNYSIQNKFLIGFSHAIERYFRTIQDKVKKYGRFTYQSVIFQDTK